MAYYSETSQWNQSGRQSSWEQPAPPSRSGASSAVQRDEPSAFQAQLEEVDRAIENLAKSGKMFGNMGMPPANRRESMPVIPRGGAAGGYPDYDPRMGGGPQRHHSVSDYDGMRPPSATNATGYYASQRGTFGPRPSEADSMMQAKRRMAAQRERELRNYHQEQQYNRHVSGAKSDRSMSPSAMNEDDRRELIARQHRALYGETSQLYAPDGTPRSQSSQDARVATTSAGRNQSPLAFDPFGMPGQGSNNGGSNGNNEGSVQMPQREQGIGKDASAGAQRSRANSNSSPASNPNTSFSLYDTAQQSNRTSASSPGGSPPRQGSKGPTSAGVAPIGTRPSQQQGPMSVNQLNKRSTTPLPSPLSFGFSASQQQQNERSTSASSNPSSGAAEKGSSIGWGSNSGVWGSTKNSLGVQASVWG